MPLLSSGQPYCRQAARHSGSSFYGSLWFLTSPRREAMFAVYSFCRAVDDVVDSDAEPEVARVQLAQWLKEIRACYEGAPTHPVAQALYPVVRTYELPRQYFEDLITGMEWDLERHGYLTFSELNRYCYHVAGVVGLIAVRIFGCRQTKQADAFALNLGTAFQLTNILRDIATDAARGRVYLPEEDLTQFGVTAEQLKANQSGEAFRRLMAFECQRARDYFSEARAYVHAQDRWRLTPALSMAGVYQRYLDQIETANYDVFSAPITLSPFQKLTLALKGALLP